MKKPLRIVSIGLALLLWAGMFTLPAFAAATPETATQGDVYVTEAVVTTQAGGEVTEVHEGDRVNVVLRVVDHPAATYHVTANEIIARVNSTIFTYTGTAEVSQLFEAED